MSNSQRNNFNLIRLAAATQVLLDHLATHFEISSPLLAPLRMFPGVPIFFFISGFLIYTSFDRLKNEGWQTFYFNRLIRIYPGLIVCVGLSLLAVVMTGYFRGQVVSPFQMAAWLFSQITVAQFYNPAFLRGYGVGVLNGALWTISVEVQFYVLVPLLYYLLHRRKGGWVALLLASVVLNLGLRWARTVDLLGWKFGAVTFLPWVYMFMGGFWLSSRPQIQARLRQVSPWLLVAGFIFAMVLIPDLRTNSSNEINPFGYAFLAAIIFRVAYADLGAFGRLFHGTDLSYGLYLYHMPIINTVIYAARWSSLAEAAAVIVGSFCLAAVSWVLVEKPALGLKKRMAARPVVVQLEPGAL